jgi:hypothetical protein
MSFAKQEFIHKVARHGAERTSLKYSSPRIGFKDIYGQQKQGDLRCGER